MGRIWAQVQPVRVGHPPELSRWAAGAGESIHSVELAVVHYRILDAARFGYRAEVSPVLKLADGYICNEECVETILRSTFITWLYKQLF